MDRLRVLATASRAVLGLILVELVVSILARWPHQFGGHGDPNRMTQQFVSSGTALAPPVFIMLGLLIVALLAGRQDRWGLVAAILMVVVGAVMVVGSLGEALAGTTPDVPQGVQIIGGVVDVSCSIGLTLVAVWDVSRRIRQSDAQPAGQS